LVADADIVINAVDDRATQAAVAEGLRAQNPDVPLAVIATGDGRRRTPGGVRFPSMHAVSSQLCRVRRSRKKTNV
jgi:hypothetical protein